MAFINFFIFLLKFEKVEETGIIATKFSLRCTPSVILGWGQIQTKLWSFPGSLFDRHLSFPAKSEVNQVKKSHNFSDLSLHNDISQQVWEYFLTLMWQINNWLLTAVFSSRMRKLLMFFFFLVSFPKICPIFYFWYIFQQTGLLIALIHLT